MQLRVLFMAQVLLCLPFVLYALKREKRQEKLTFGLGAGASSASGGNKQNESPGGSKQQAEGGIQVRTGAGHKNQCERVPGYKCVPYYQCQDDGTIITDGSGLIDIRDTNLRLCPLNLDVCCFTTTDHHPTPTPPIDNDGFCGERNSDGVHVRVGGLGVSEAQFGEFPWMVAILRVEVVGTKEVKLYICGGSLIAPDVVLTAAHCIHRYGNTASLVVRGGEWDTQQTYEIYPHIDVKVANVIIHEHFNPENLKNDVALLQLRTPFDMAPHILPICLPYNIRSYQNLHCFASGWGQDKFDGNFQNVLKQVALKLVDNFACQDELRKTRLGQYFELDDSFVCAGGERGVDTCKGDGGSPLVCSENPLGGPYFQIGIVAWGIGCGEKGIPGVYADVVKSLDWITNNARSGYLCKQRQWFDRNIRC